RNSTGSGFSPALGAPTRLRQRLSLVLPLVAQYSELQISPSAAAASVAACPGERPAVRPRPTPAPRTVPRAMSSMAVSPEFGLSCGGRPFRRNVSRMPGAAADGRPADEDLWLAGDRHGCLRVGKPEFAGPGLAESGGEDHRALSGGRRGGSARPHR